MYYKCKLPTMNFFLDVYVFFRSCLKMFNGSEHFVTGENFCFQAIGCNIALQTPTTAPRCAVK